MFFFSEKTIRTDIKLSALLAFIVVKRSSKIPVGRSGQTNNLTIVVQIKVGTMMLYQKSFTIKGGE